jgi:hypothetical protein
MEKQCLLQQGVQYYDIFSSMMKRFLNDLFETVLSKCKFDFTPKNVQCSLFLPNLENFYFSVIIVCTLYCFFTCRRDIREYELLSEAHV